MSDLVNKISGPGGAYGVGRVNMPITTGRPLTIGAPTVTDTGQSFRELLEASLGQTEELTFSKHAMSRVEQRGVALTTTDLDRLSQAVSKAEEKGITQSLLLMNDTAFIVNIPNRVVVTVVDSADTEHNVFTNINGAVIV